MPEPYSEAARMLGERMRKVRHQRSLSQEEVANLAEIHVTNYGKIERGRANPSLTTIVRIASALNADPGTLVTGISVESAGSGVHQLTPADLIHKNNNRRRGLR